MRYINRLDEIDLKNTALTIGKFEAIHKGHLELIKAIVNKKTVGLNSCVFTIKTNDISIYTDVERRYIFEKYGIDTLIELDFNEIKDIEYDDFIKNILIDKLDINYLVCGDDFTFGKNKLGNSEILKKLLIEYGCVCDIYSKLYYDNEEISSTRIKNNILNGEIEKANDMLAASLFVYGNVVYGNQIGRSIEVPTANIRWDSNKLLPPFGVYASKIIIDSNEFFGISNIGIKPTINIGNQPLIETNIFNFDKNIYGKEIFVYLYKYIRKETCYSSINKLEMAIKEDIEKTKEFFKL